MFIKSQLKDLVHSVDISKINTHFPEDSQPENIAYRSVAVALSDLAAMGAYPSFISIGLTSNSNNIEWYKKFTSGLETILNEYQIKLIGGDVTNGTNGTDLTFSELALSFGVDDLSVNSVGSLVDLYII